MVNDRDVAPEQKKLRTFAYAGTVGIDDYDERILVRKRLRARVFDDVVFARRLGCLVYDAEGVIVLVDNYICILVPRLCQPVHAEGRSERVHVRIAVSHDQHVRCRVYQAAESVAYDPGFSLVPLFDGLCPAAVKADMIALLDDRLVSSSCKSKIEGLACAVVVGERVLAAYADTDRKSDREVTVGIYFPHLIEHREAAPLLLLEVAALEDQHV